MPQLDDQHDQTNSNERIWIGELKVNFIWGLKNMLVTSVGRDYQNPHVLERNLKKRARLNRSLRHKGQGQPATRSPNPSFESGL